MLHLTINEQPRIFNKPLTIAELLTELGRDPKRIAVELNEQIVRREEHAARTLNDGDRLEIVTLVEEAAASCSTSRWLSASSLSAAGYLQAPANTQPTI